MEASKRVFEVVVELKKKYIWEMIWKKGKCGGKLTQGKTIRRGGGRFSTLMDYSSKIFILR